jgi:hypothetical protein
MNLGIIPPFGYNGCGGVMVSTWKLFPSGMRRTSVGLLNHPTNKINDEVHTYAAAA